MPRGRAIQIRQGRDRGRNRRAANGGDFGGHNAGGGFQGGYGHAELQQGRFGGDAEIEGGVGNVREQRAAQEHPPEVLAQQPLIEELMRYGGRRYPVEDGGWMVDED
jgi:hypothetical protein